jgi:DNA-binding HxlR family transcriptional regulator
MFTACIKGYSMIRTLDIYTLYQHLNELENLGMIVRNTTESFRGKPIRFYHKITRRGKIAARIWFGLGRKEGHSPHNHFPIYIIAFS